MSRRIGPTAYVDEAFIQERGHPGVYLLAAVLVEHDELDTVTAATRAAAGDEPFHATDLNRRGQRHVIGDVLDVVSQQASWTIVVAHTPIAERNDVARQITMQRLLRELNNSRVSDVVLDVRGDVQEWRAATAAGLPMPRINYRDRATYHDLAVSRQISHRMRLMHRDDRTEPGLWLADAVAWSARRMLAFDEPRWFDRVADATTVYEASTGHLLALNSDGAAPPDGDRGPHGQAQRGPETAAQPMLSPPPYLAAVVGDQYTRMGTFMASVLVQAQQARQPAAAAPSDVEARLLGFAEQIAGDIAVIRRALGAAPEPPVPLSPLHTPGGGTDPADISPDVPSVTAGTGELELD